MPKSFLQDGAQVSNRRILIPVLLYAAFASLWILVSDQAVEWLFADPSKIILVSTLKGWIFVAVTSVLLYGLIKRLFEGLRKSEERFRLAMDATNDALWDWDIPTDITYYSPQYYRMIGFEPNEFPMTANEWIDLIHPDDREAVLIANNDCIENKTPSFEVLYRLKTKSGDWKWILGRGSAVIRDSSGKALRMIGTHVDITERKKAEEALKESEEKYRIIFNNEIFAVCIFDSETLQLLDANDAHIAMYGYSKEELLSGMIALDLTAQYEVSKKSVEEINLKGTSFVPLRYHRKKDGTVFPVEIAAGPYMWRGRKVICALVHEISDRIKAEAEIQREKIFTNAVLDSVPGLLYLYNEDGYLVRWNKKHEEVTGYSADELSRMHVLDWYKGDDRETAVIKAGVERAFRDGFADAEARLTTKTGAKIPYYFTAVRLTIEDKNYFVGVGLDITQRRRAEDALKESEEKFSKSFHDAPILMTISKIEDGTYIDANNKFIEVSGFSREDVIGKTSVELGWLKSEDRDRLVMALEREGRIAGTDLTLSAKDGRQVHCYYQGEIITIQGRQRLLSIAIDITERKQARKALIESESKFRTLFEESRDVIFISTTDGKILDVNQAGVDLFGYRSKKDLIDNVDLGRDLYVNQEDRKAFRAEIDRKQFVKDYPLTMKKADGEKLDVLASVSVVRNYNGDIVGYRGILRDITSHKKLEQQLLQAQKMEAVGQLAGGIAHDFNNILSAITGYSYLLSTKLADDDPCAADVEQILDAANKASELTHSLLAFSRKQIMNPKPVRIDDIVRRTEKLLHRIIGEDIEIRTELAGNNVFFRGDASQIEQVLMNLATNARDAMPLGGRLSLRTAVESMDDGFIRLNGFGRQGEYVLMSVSDTGTGIKQEDISKIFEPFFTTKEVGRGTGLGLAMVYGIIKQHEGYITVSSGTGKGTTFNIYLPALEMSQEAPAEPTVKPEIRGGSETILVGEDDEVLRRLFKAVLIPYGYKVILARDGDEAVSEFAKNRDNIKLVVMDMIMPKKSGIEAYEEIKRICPDIKILFASGYTADKITQGTLHVGDLNILQKPVTPNELLKKIREMLDK